MLTIKTIDNGWIVEDGEQKNAFTFSDYNEEDSKEMMIAKRDVLYAVLEYIGFPSKHNHWGISVEIRKDEEIVEE